MNASYEASKLDGVKSRCGKELVDEKFGLDHFYLNRHIVWSVKCFVGGSPEVLW